MSLKIKGVDISYCQKGLDYEKIKAAGVKFAIIRAGANLREDSLLDYHIKGCKSIGIDHGYYWYCYANNVDGAVKEAQKCLEVISKYDKPTYPVFFDMEEQSQTKLGKAVCTEMALKFCETIENGGYPAGVYANPAWLESFYNKKDIIGKYDIWLAHWTENPDRPSSYNYGQTMHQWGLDNIGMNIDGDICYIDYPAKTAEWYKAHGANDEAPVEPAPIAPEQPEAPDVPTVPETPSEPETPTAPTVPEPIKSDFAVGDKVMLKSGAKFSNGVTPFDWVFSTVFDVQQISKDGKELLIGLHGNATGWVYAEDCRALEGVVKLSVGDTVKVRNGAKTYYGDNLASFVYSQKYTVIQVGTRNLPDYIVIGKGDVVTAAVKAEDIILA